MFKCWDGEEDRWVTQKKNCCKSELINTRRFVKLRGDYVCWILGDDEKIGVNILVDIGLMIIHRNLS